MPFISNAQLDKYAINPEQYPETTKMLVGFAKGKRIEVTYYRILNRTSGSNRTNVADMGTMRNILDSEYQKILRLEITLRKGFDFTNNNAQANGTITGQAVFYPYMNPSIGDIFLTPIGDGRIGLCRISKVDASNWRQDRTFAVEFVVQEFLDEATAIPLDAAVTTTSVFSKANYLGGTASLLSEQTYVYLQTIMMRRRVLLRLYHQLFFDTRVNSYMRPDGVYDPWVVQFLTHKLTVDDVIIRPKNLLGIKPSFYNQTLWARLEDGENRTMYNLSPYTIITPYRQTRMGVFVTELVKRSVVMPSSDGDVTNLYLYSEDFYKGVTANMIPEELLVYTALTQRSAGDLAAFVVQYLDTVYSLTKDQMFYKIPVYIHLIDMMLQSQYREGDAPSISTQTP